MPYDLIGTLIVGAAAALFTWLAYRAFLRRPMPRRVLPVVVGLAMLGYAVWSEYSWGARTRYALPAGIEVIERLSDSSLWRPWTLLVPRVSRMIAIDRAAMRRNVNHPQMVLVDVILLERWAPARQVIRLIDCSEARSADVTDPAALADGGLPPANAWSAMVRDGTLYQSVCAAGRG